MAEKKRVIIVGGGYGGIQVASLLDELFDVTIVERRNYFFHNIGALRATVEEAQIPKLFVPQDKLLSNGRFVHGEVKEVAKDHLLVVHPETKEESQMTFDYLVIATGSTSPFPGSTSATQSVGQKLYRLTRERIQKAEKILIVGGGPVGIELSGEIATDFPAKKVTLIHGDKLLLSAHFPEKFRTQAVRSLEELGVQVLLSQTVDSKQFKAKKHKKTEENQDDGKEDEPEEEEVKRLVPSLKKRTVTTSKGEEVEADLIFNCTGSKVNNDCLKQNFADSLDESGRLKVNSHLQVGSYSNILALGDITNTPEAKMAYTAGRHAPVIANNIKVLAGNAKKLKDYSPSKPMMALTTGRNGGRLLTPLGVLGNTLTRFLKSKDVLTPRMWSSLHATMPK